MTIKYSSLMKNQTWELVPLPKGRNLVCCKWVYQIKYVTNGSIDKYKSHLMDKGFSQVEGIDYTDIFSPITNMNYVYLVLALVASHDCSIF